MAQIVSKGKKDICVTLIPYPPHIVRSMKQAGYKVRNVEDSEVMHLFPKNEDTEKEED